MISFLGEDSRFKRKDEIISKFPIVFGDYYEPFLRHGSIFFNLYNHKRVFGKAFLASQDADIARAYNAVKEQPERVQKVLAHCVAKNSATFYEAMSRQLGNPTSLIYCYRAGYPDWDKRQYVSWGKKMTQDLDCIGVCSRYLNKWCEWVRWYNWEESLMSVKENDLVFCDPQDFGCGPNGFLTDRYQWLESFLVALKGQRKCHVVMIKDEKVIVF